MPTDPTTVLFAAGRGERLRPLTDTVPKPCLPLLDIPLGVWGLGALLSLGGEVIVNASYRAPEVAAALEPYAGDARFVVESPHPYGTAGTLAALREEIGPRVLTWNADVLTDLDPSELLGTHKRLGAPATLAVAEVGAGADLELNGDSASGFVDRRTHPDAAGARFIGVAVFEDDVLAHLPDTRPLGVAEALLKPLIERGEVAAHRHGAYALDIGVPERYLQANLDLLDGRGPLPTVPYPGSISGTGGGRYYVGPGGRAAPGTLGPGAIVLAGACVRPGARVSHAVVWKGEEVPSGTLAERTVWAGGARLIG